MDTEKMGRFIAERRKDKHMTQKDFARMLLKLEVRFKSQQIHTLCQTY